MEPSPALRVDGGYRPALDGIRALAVVAVIVFHLDRLPGGYLGVDAFFVLSGWLITWKLLDEADRTRTIRLRKFWGARMRRIMPASLIVLFTVALVWTIADIPVPSLRRDLLWAAGWLANWGTITGGGDYWARFGEPSPVTHFWSLAIEEQYYLVWPFLVLLVVSRTKRHRRSVGILGGVLAVASIVVMNVIFDPGNSTAAYVNTVARMHTLLIGAVAAAATPLRADGRLEGGAFARRLAPAGAVVAIGVLVLASDDADWMFRFGFPLFAVAMAAVVVAAADGAGVRWLGTPPLRWVGDRSYGLYLWHWPVFLFLSSDRLGVSESFGSRVLLDVVRVAVTVLVADLSFRFLETPIRRRRVLTPRTAAVAAAFSVTAVALVAVVVVPSRQTEEISIVTLPPLPAPATTVAASEATDPSAAGGVPDGPVDSPPEAAQLNDQSTSPSTPIDRPMRVLVTGDSTGQQLSEALIAHAETVPHRLVVGAAAFGGCGLSVADDGRLHEYTVASGETELFDLSNCVALWETIPGRVVEEEIDVVLVDIGAWDAVDMQLADGSVSSIADPQGAAFIEDNYRRFVETVEGAGASVVWVTPPDVRLDEARWDDPVNDPARWVALRSMIGRLGVTEIDLRAWLAEEGASGPDGRPDGVHLTPELNERFAIEVVARTIENMRTSADR